MRGSVRPPSTRLPFPLVVVAVLLAAMVVAALAAGRGALIAALLFVTLFAYLVRSARPGRPDG